MERCEMCHSEGSDNEDWQDAVQFKLHKFPGLPMEPLDICSKLWAQINPELRREVGHLMHVSVFWWHILYKQQDNHRTTEWAVDMGFLDPNVLNDLSLKRLYRIEILELILDSVEKCLEGPVPEQKAEELIMIGVCLQIEEDGLMKAVTWLIESGSPGLSRKILHLGPKHLRHQVLDYVFSAYSHYIQVMSRSKNKLMKALSLDPEPWSLQKSDEMKNKGNEQFQKRNYAAALKWYTKAIKYHTNNHILYGNRALCYLRCEKYLKAMGDGKRAILLQRDWAKGHYRFCDALFYLGARDKAVEANLRAQSYCSADPEGIKDLQQQYSRFMGEMSDGRAEGKQKKTEAKKEFSKSPEEACGVDPMAHHVYPDNALETSRSSDTEEDKKAEDTKQEEPSAALEKNVNDFKLEDNFKDAKSEMGDRKAKKATAILEKQTVRNKQPPIQSQSSSSSSSGEVYNKAQFCAAVRDAHIALSDQRSRNAEQSFSEALRILDSIVIKDLGICEMDKTLLIYGYATSLIEIAQPEELAEAQHQFKKLISTANRTFQSLVHYGLGKVFLKENKFSDAKDEFLKALLMVQRQIMPGKLTWPTTKVTIKETCPEYLTEQLESFIKFCKFPPKPDAVCRHCLGRDLIYFTDPDFKGFIRLSCSQSCNVEYHINCWKKFKAASFSDKNDKDFLQDLCLTPDCAGKVCRISIFDSTGLVKREFTAHVSKSKVPGIRVKQKCTSLKKLEAKEERKLRRKEKRAALSKTKYEKNNFEMEDECEKGAESIDQSLFKDVVYRDRVLHQIDKNRDLFNDETDISSMLVCLKPWLKLDEDKGHVSILKDSEEPQLLIDLVDLLLERKNRVWARIFLHSLSGYQHVKPKVLEWAQKLNNAGLKAAEKFIGQFAHNLEDLDLSPMSEFPPLHDLFHNAGFTVVEYLRRAPPQEMRLFIWALEEHRDDYPSWFISLDDYFEMDSICLVLKKTEKDDHLSSAFKCKSKHRKKKQKEPKSILFLAGRRREEEDNCFLEENSLMLLDDADPFSVPHYLREQVAEFEGQYVKPGYSNHFKRFLDNNPDPTKESLYDYFAQILEEHGPLQLSDSLLVGELENFPTEAQQKIDAAGGLKEFLLESLRFVMLDDVIVLASQAVCFQHSMDDYALQMYDFPSHTCSMDDSMSKDPSLLNPTAKEFLPQSTNFNEDSESCEPHASCPVLPSPYVLVPQVPQNFNYAFGMQDISRTLKPEEEYSDYFSNVELTEFNDETFSSDNYTNFKEDTCAKSKSVFVQTICCSKDSRDDVAINTEPYAVFEKNRGDMIQTEKNNIKIEKQIQKLKEMLEKSKNEREELRSLFEAEVKGINQHIEVANKELSMFQQKLEDELRKDQQEKRDQQETLKVLRGQIKDLVDCLESLSKQIQDKDVEFQSTLSHFLELSNHWALEKMNLEEGINKCTNQYAKATSRSLAGQVSILKNKQEHDLRGLRKFLKDGKAILKHLTEMSPMHLSAGFSNIIGSWTSCIQEVEENIAKTEIQYEGQIELVKKGNSLSSLPAVAVPRTPVPPAVPAFLQPFSNKQSALQQLPVQHTLPFTPYGIQQPPARPQAHTAVNTHHALHTLATATENIAAPVPPVTSAAAQPPQSVVFERIVDRLSSMFPYYSRSVLMKFIQEVRSMNGGSLSMLKYEELISRAAQLILDRQEHSQMTSRDVAAVRNVVVPSPTPPPTDSSRATATASPTHVWKSVSSHQRKSSRALNMEDPCIICHEDMMPEDLCVLECRHSFHRECIKSWLKEQSTCPTCREHALLPEDFPMLPGRHRRGHMHAATSS